MANYRLLVSISTIEDGWHSTIQLPTFVLEGDVLGLVDHKHAEKLAESMLQQLLPHAGIAAFAAVVEP